MKPRDMHLEEEWARCAYCQGSGVRVNEKGQPLVSNEKRLTCVFCTDAGHPGVVLVSRKVKYAQPMKEPEPSNG